ncbi:MAG: SagB/ThcOx family dehydrogenase [Planctomycetota bacterium]|jgi:SagB-type dehydrogenase family enzyme
MGASVGRDFMRRTRYRFLAASPQTRGEPPPPLELPAPQGAERVALPRPDAFTLPPLDFRKLVRERASLREYSRAPLSLEELAFLLWATQGVKSVEGDHATFRTVPSAGARHALETFALANRVDGLAPGLWRYMALSHELVLTDDSRDVAARMVEACHGQRFVATSAATFVWAAVPERMTWRYSERGWRYLLLDAGHACQNLYLAAEAVGGGACAVAAFDDAALDRVLGLDGDTAFAIYLAAAGKRG